MNNDEQREIFDDWFTRFKPLVLKIVRAFAFTTADQDDLFQEIALQAWKSIPTFRNQSAVSTWLYRIALNTSIKWSQKEKKHRTSRVPIDNEEPLLQEGIEPMDDRLLWIYEEIAGLEVVGRSLALLLLDGLSYKEMSNVLGISESNVGVKINRIKKKLVGKSKTMNYGI